MVPPSAIDNTILVERDYARHRQEFLEQVTREENRSRLDTLGPYPYYFAQLFPKTSGWGAGGEIKKRVNLYGIGLMELAGYLVTWLLILGLLLSNEAEALLIALFILSFAHLGDALVTWVVVRKGLIPRRCEWGRGRN